MKILAIKSSGDRTSISLMLNDEINSFTMDHDRKDRPNWDMFFGLEKRSLSIQISRILNSKELNVFWIIVKKTKATLEM